MLVVDASHSGRSIFALIRGFVEEAGPGSIAGVILNRLGSEGHETYLKKACAGMDIPVYGMLPKMSELQWPERHLGLQASQEQEFPNIEILSEKVENHLDLDGILDLMEIPLRQVCLVYSLRVMFQIIFIGKLLPQLDRVVWQL